MKRKTLAVLIISMLLLICFAVFYMTGGDKEPVAAADEVLLLFDLNTSDEIYQVSIEYMIDGEIVGDAGTRNANGTPFAENERIYYSFRLDAAHDISKLSLQLYVADFINDFGDHKSEYRIENEIKLSAEYGNTYYITIAGDKETGYTAFLKTADTNANLSLCRG